VVTLLVVEAESELDPAAAKFQEELAALKREFGAFDETDIFSPDISEPSKMKAMKLPLVPGTDPHAIRPYHKRFTPPMKEEMRAQVNKMLNYQVCQRGDGNTVVSNVHLAPKPEKPPAPPGAGASPSEHGGGGGGGGGSACQSSQHSVGRSYRCSPKMSQFYTVARENFSLMTAFLKRKF
jgi:hypothetical protein